MQKLTGANMDIDLTTPPDEITWSQSPCPWNVAEAVAIHRCAVKNISICPCFRGIEPPDTVLCAYPDGLPGSPT